MHKNRLPSFGAVLIAVFFFLGLLSVSISADTTSSSLLQKIVSLSFSGNRTTQESTLRMYLANWGIDTGTYYDSIKIAEVKRKLIMTNLFYNIDFVTTPRKDGVCLMVILQEIFYYNPGGNLEYYQTTDKKDSWYKLSLGLTKLNFRGRMETVNIGVSGWKDRSIGVSWSKPLLPSKYYLGLGGGVYYYSELNYPRDRMVTTARVFAGKDISLHSKGFLSISPTVSDIDTITTNRTPIKEIKEVTSSIGWVTDYRNNNFDPVSGWFISNEFLSNILYSNDAITYGQYNVDFRIYIPGLFQHNRIACRFQGRLRTNDAGPYRRLYAGGESTLRGFPNDFMGMSGPMNNSLIGSVEYRFPIATIKKHSIFSLSFLTSRIPELKGLYYQIDGALIGDGGHLWNHFTQPMQERENGGGIGAGVKLLVPTMRRSLCFDVVSPIMKDQKSRRTTLYTASAEYRLYLDAHY